MFATSAECLLNNLLSRICLLRFFKHNDIKMSKTHFFKWHPAFIIALVESFFVFKQNYLDSDLNERGWFLVTFM
jgi:hypothetical protein